MIISTGLQPTVERSGPGGLTNVRLERIEENPRRVEIVALLATTSRSVEVAERHVETAIPVDDVEYAEEAWRRIAAREGVPADAVITETEVSPRRTITRRADWYEVRA